MSMGLLQTTKLNTNLTTVPEAVRNFLELDSNGRIEWHVEDGEVVVRKQSAPAKSSEATQ